MKKILSVFGLLIAFSAIGQSQTVLSGPDLDRAVETVKAHREHRVGIAAGTSAGSSAVVVPTGGSRYFDVRNSMGGTPGAVVGNANAVRTRKAIQAAIDAVTDAGKSHTVYIPSGDWWVDRPLMMDRNANLVGEPGGGATITGVGETTPVLVGVSRAGYNRTQPLAASHLDGGTGATFKGLYLDPGEHAYLWSTPFSHGQYPFANGGFIDAYTITQEVTIEWQQDLGANPILTGPIMGLSNSQAGIKPDPWALTYTPVGGNWNGTAGTAGALRAQFQVKDGSKYGALYNASFTLPSPLTGIADFAVTISPKQGKAAAWVNGVQLAPLMGGLTTLPAPGSWFQPNTGTPFQIANDTELLTGVAPGYQTGNAPAGSTATTALNRNITGLRFWGAAPYVLTNAAGSAQVRTDAGPLDPGNVAGARYRRQEPGVLAWIPFSDTTADVLANRQFTVKFGSGFGSYPSVCGCIVPNTFAGFDWQHGSIQNLTLGQSGGSYGAALGLGYVGDFEIRDCTFNGSMYGVGMLQTGSSYTVRLTGFNKIGSNDVGLYVYFCDLQQEGKLEFTSYGRNCILGAGACGLKFQYIYVVGSNSQAAYLIRTTSAIEIERLNIDIEFNIPQNLSYIRVDSLRDIPSGLNCVLGTVSVSLVPPGMSVVYLDTTDTDQFYGKISLANFSSFNDGYKSVIEVNGKAPMGQIEETQVLSSPWILNSTSDGLSSVTVNHRPGVIRRHGFFSRNSDILKPARPVDGQFTEFRCAQTGRYRTGAPGIPPRWVGIAPIDDSGTALATYIQANFAWTSGNTIAAEGPASDLATSQFLDGYFGLGQLFSTSVFGSALPAGAPPPPASIVAALVTTPPSGGARIAGEVGAGVGYARQAVSFGAPAAGSTGNAATVTFPTFTGTPAGPIVGVTLLDSGTGLVVGAVPLDPINATAGTSIAFPPGTLKLQAVPVPAGGSLAPQMGTLGTPPVDAFLNWHLRAQPIVPPTGLQFALSTAPASTAPPTEPVGNGYARVPAGGFAPSYSQAQAGSNAATTSNATDLTFPTPTGDWPTVKSLYLLDGASNVLFSGNLTIPRTAKAGAAPLKIFKGGFHISY